MVVTHTPVVVVTPPCSGGDTPPSSGGDTHPSSGGDTHPSSGGDTHPGSGGDTHSEDLLMWFMVDMLHNRPMQLLA